MKHDFDRYCTRNIQVSLDQDRFDILTKLEYLAKKKIKEDFTSINYYKSLPVKYSAKLIDVESSKKTVMFEVNPIQAVAINNDQYSFLKSGIFQNTVLGLLQYINIKKRIVVLTDFVFVQLLSEKREAVRVVLDKKIPTYLIINKEQYKAFIIDISTAGLSILCEDQIPTDTITEMEIVLPIITIEEKGVEEEKQTLITKVQLIKAGKTKASQYVLFLSFLERPMIDLYFSKFILSRQIEIKKELEYQADLFID